MSNINTGRVAAMTAVGLLLAAPGCNVPPEEEAETETGEPAALVSRNSATPETRRQIGVVSWDFKKTSKDFWINGLGANGTPVFRARLKPHFNGQGMILSIKKPTKQIIAIRGQEVLNCNDVRNCVPFSPGQLDGRVRASVERLVSDLSARKVPYSDLHCDLETVVCGLHTAECAVDISRITCGLALLSCGSAAIACGVLDPVIDSMMEPCSKNIIYCPGSPEVPY